MVRFLSTTLFKEKYSSTFLLKFRRNLHRKLFLLQLSSKPTTKNVFSLVFKGGSFGNPVDANCKSAITVRDAVIADLTNFLFFEILIFHIVVIRSVVCVPLSEFTVAPVWDGVDSMVIEPRTGFVYFSQIPFMDIFWTICIAKLSPDHLPFTFRWMTEPALISQEYTSTAVFGPIGTGWRYYFNFQHL